MPLVSGTVPSFDLLQTQGHESSTNDLGKRHKRHSAKNQELDPETEEE